MAIDSLRIAAFCAYLAAWLVFAIAAVVGAIPKARHAASTMRVSAPVLIGMLLQAAAAFAITRSMKDGPLRPRTLELACILLLAPLGAAIFVWALRSVPRDAGAETLVTGGAYAWLRHPIYLAFLVMLVATGMVLSAGIKLILPVLLYLAGSELRIASEEEELAARFPEDYAKYQSKTRRRYLPGLR